MKRTTGRLVCLLTLWAGLAGVVVAGSTVPDGAVAGGGPEGYIATLGKMQGIMVRDIVQVLRGGKIVATAIVSKVAAVECTLLVTDPIGGTLQNGDVVRFLKHGSTVSALPPASMPAAQAVPPPTQAADAKVMVINNDKPGYPVDLAKFAVPGKTTIFDFYSQYCGPCMQLSPKLDALANSRSDIFVRKIDINRKGTVGIDWQSPAAKEYKLNSIPHLRIVGPDGKVQAEGDAAYDLTLKWIGE